PPLRSELYALSLHDALPIYRRIFALLFRTAVFTLLVLALAGIQLQKISDRMTVIYLLDQSESIPKPTREAMLTYVSKDIEKHRRSEEHTSELQSPYDLVCRL